MDRILVAIFIAVAFSPWAYTFYELGRLVS
jgi:hypothetical protein